MPRKVNLIPLAGAGRRFVEAGYTTPKPLIPVAGIPMVIKASECLPLADEWIFICREHHIRKSSIDTALRKHFQGAKILSVAELTEGQACTCLLAKELLQPDDLLTIGACDNSMTYNTKAFEALITDQTVDVIIWTFRRNSAVLQNPKMYGWVLVDKEDYVQKVSCKVLVSDSPMDDHAVIGAFTFKRAGDFIRCAKDMIAENRRVNNEFYIDEVMNVAVESGLNVKVFEVQRYICWGTPQDVETYNYWQGYFRQIEQVK